MYNNINSRGTKKYNRKKDLFMIQCSYTYKPGDNNNYKKHNINNLNNINILI